MTDTLTDVERYGKHDFGCYSQLLANPGPCTCGLDVAVERAREARRLRSEEAAERYEQGYKKGSAVASFLREQLAQDRSEWEERSRVWEETLAQTRAEADARVDALRAQLAEARGKHEKLFKLASFLKCVIKCGEPWTSICEDVYCEALSSAPTEPATAPGEASPGVLDVARLHKKFASLDAEPTFTPPRYDDVFAEGMKWLDSLAAEPETEPTFSTRWSEDDSEWVGLCSAFPSLSWLAPSKEEALEGIKRLVREERAPSPTFTMEQIERAIEEARRVYGDRDPDVLDGIDVARVFILASVRTEGGGE